MHTYLIVVIVGSMKMTSIYDIHVSLYLCT